MKLMGTDPRLKQAQAAWAEIAPDLGLDTAAYRAKLIWQKDEPARSHIVVRLKGPRPLILKQVFAAPDDADLSAAIAAQRDAFERLAGSNSSHAPEVLFASDDGRIVVMAEAAGKTLNDHLLAGKPHDKMLRRAGAWLGAFHGSGPLEERTYQPKFMLRHAARMRDAVRAGTLRVALPKMFVACCEQMPDKAAAAMDQQTTSAAKHGDFNLRNLLLGPEGETGLDFKPASTAPVGFDIARLLMDYAELFQPGEDVSEGRLLSDATLDAFFDGYRLVERDDPAVRFLPFVQLLNDWRLIPPNKTRRSWRQAARMDRIEALARTAFALN
ncbi:aminoglycoside phosphotransferase family protein [uncultured Tateyamaria sp.]|uniref:aminoglycoside phosphotransferase family protein n=1 Tax=uncultured Tateyamaria sp. TaxID=455651 RepID=UPI002624C9D2|nr:aminoglycoside phosphotransferase family protein [uncultured Tateyamaria sp.]